MPKSVENLYTIDSHRVQVLMAEQQLKLKHLADKLSVTIGAIHHVITNKRPGSPLVPRLAGVLGVSLETILVQPKKSKVVKAKRKAVRRPSSSSPGERGLAPLAASSPQN